MNRYYTAKGEVGEREAKEIEKQNKEITSKPLSGEWLKVRFILKADTERPEQWGGTANRAASRPSGGAGKAASGKPAKPAKKTVRKWREVKVDPNLGVRTVVTVSEDGKFRQTMYDCQTGRKFRDYTIPVTDMGYENAQALLRDHKSRGRKYAQVPQGQRPPAKKPKNGGKK